MAEANPHHVTELYLYAVNTGALYSRVTIPAINNMAKKKAKGQYDHEKARKAFYRVAEAAARMYGREHDKGERAGLDVFTVADRQAVAVDLLEHYAELIDEQASVSA